jgi:DNA-binding SARP family transcriptional activator
MRIGDCGLPPPLLSSSLPLLLSSSPPMLRLYLLGRLHITLDGQPVPFASQRAELLLAYLALQPRPHGREALATLLWDDRTHEQSLSNLRSLLAQLPDPIKPLLTADRKAIYWAEEAAVWVDVHQFEQELAQSQTAAQTISALAHYGGPFLAGVTIRDSYGLEEWLALQRERIQQLALRAYQQAAEHSLLTRQLDEALGYARALRELAPFYEEGVRLLLRCYGQMGHKTAAHQRYTQLAQQLAAELGVEPTAETTTLHQRIQQMHWPIPHHVPPLPAPLSAELAAQLPLLATRLADPHCQLLTLAGETAALFPLALALADQRRGDYLGGIFAVSLAENHAPLPAAVAGVMGLATAERLLPTLCRQECLLLLHPFDPHDEAAVAWVQTVLEQCPAVQLLLVAPEPLYLRAEWLG